MEQSRASRGGHDAFRVSPRRPTRILWVSDHHRPHGRQWRELRKRFGNNVEVEFDNDSYDSAEDIIGRFKAGKYDELIFLGPVAVLIALRQADPNIHPIMSVMAPDKSFVEFVRFEEMNIKSKPL